MIDFPVCLRLHGRRVVLVGGGRIAEARAEQLLDAGAHLTVIAPELTATLSARAVTGALRVLVRPYLAGDLAGAQLAFVATDDRSVSEAAATEARARGILINTADEPDLCDFTLPSVGRSGDVTVAVSTGGHAPAVAASLRRRLMRHVGAAPVARTALSGWVRRALPRSAARQRLLRFIARFPFTAPGETT